MAKGKVPNWLFTAIHPFQAATVLRRQLRVSVNLADPPRDITVDTFVTLPLNVAAKLIKSEQKRSIRLGDWPSTSQVQMTKGEIIHPNGRHPEHPNV